MIPILKRMCRYFGDGPYKPKTIQFEVTATGSVAMGFRGISGKTLIVDPGDGTGFDYVTFAGFGSGTPWTHDYTATPGTWTVTMYGVENIYYLYANGVPICDISVFMGLIRCQVFEINDCAISGTFEGFFIDRFPAMVFPLQAGTCSINIKNLGGTLTIGDFRELVQLEQLAIYGNTITGNLNELSTLSNIVNLYAFGLDLTYTTPIGGWPALSGFDIRIYSCGFSSTEIDALINDPADAGWANGNYNIAGSNASRTSASDGGVFILVITNNVTLTVNE